MTNRERYFITSILLGIILLVGVDLFIDFDEGVPKWHILIEALLGVAATGGVYVSMKGRLLLRQRLNLEQKNTLDLKRVAAKWRANSTIFLEGLSQAIDEQLSEWDLSTAEKEIAFLLLKGMRQKEIAQIRNTSEKTCRAQSVSIYAKAGISGRSELAAFFLEDLLLPDHNKLMPGMNQMKGSQLSRQSNSELNG